MKYCLPISRTTTESVVMLKAVIFEAELIKTFAIAVVFGTSEDANSILMSLIIDPLLQNE